MASSLGEALDKLADTIAERAQAGAAASSYTVSLLDAGVAKCAKKFGEEAVETVIAGIEGDKARIASEAADTLYHLLVLLKAAEVPPEAVAAALDGRAGTSGLAEKAARQE